MRGAWIFGVAGWAVALIACALIVVMAGKMRGLYIKEKAAGAQFGPAILPRPAPGWAGPGEGVLLIGDSRVAQWAPLPEAPGLSFAVSGIGGETASGLGARFAGSALGLTPPPGRIVIAAGINDLVAISLSGRGEAALDQLAARLGALAEQAAGQGIPVSLMTVIRPADPGMLRRQFAWDDRIQTLVAGANRRIRALADPPRITVIDADALLAPEDGPLPARFATDALHFTPQAYEALNAGLVEALGAE